MSARKPWERADAGRSRDTRSRRRVLIVCEDEKSSRDYFQAFPVDRSRTEIVALGTGLNTLSLVEHAIGLRNRADGSGTPYASVWCVFDRDSFPENNYRKAFALARENGMRVAWANEAFELWYLLHFNYHDTALPRAHYAAKLRPHLSSAYNKADASMYDHLESRQATALKNARRLERHWAELSVNNPERENPSTGIHKLVEHLNELRNLGAA